MIVEKDTTLNTIWSNDKHARKQTSPWLSTQDEDKTPNHGIRSHLWSGHSASPASLHQVPLNKSTLVASFRSVNPSHPFILSPDTTALHTLSPMFGEPFLPYVRLIFTLPWIEITLVRDNLPWKVLWSTCHSSSFTFVCMMASSILKF